MKNTTEMHCPTFHATGQACAGCDQCAAVAVQAQPVAPQWKDRRCAAEPAAVAQPVASEWAVGSLLTMSDYDYPGMGSMFAQVWQGDDLIARVYGNTADEVRSRAARVAAPQPAVAQADADDVKALCAYLDLNGVPTVADGMHLALLGRVSWMTHALRHAAPVDATMRAAAPSAPSARDAALEEVAQWYKNTGWRLDEDDVPAAIRALAGKPEAPKGDTA